MVLLEISWGTRGVDWVQVLGLGLLLLLLLRVEGVMILLIPGHHLLNLIDKRHPLNLVKLPHFTPHPPAPT
jgi:hypothetical protein